MATRTKRLRVLHEIYTQLPTVECKGLCYRSCAAVPVYELELEQLNAIAGRTLPTLKDMAVGDQVAVLATNGIDLSCPLLVAKRCSVYNDRPLICRVFGVADGLPCEHGCEPNRPLTDLKVIEIQRQISRL